MPLSCSSGYIFLYSIRRSNFKSYSLLKHTKDVNIVIPYSTTYYTPSTYRSPAEYTFNMNEHWIRFALTEPGMMNGIFLMSCRSLANLYNQKEYNVSALKYKQKCIEMVRHDIDRNQSISDLTIVKVLFLVSDEFHTGNIEGTRSHTEAIGKLVQMRGGLKALGLEGTLQDLVLWNDRMSTFYTGTRPNFMHAETFVDSVTAKYLTPGFYHAATDGLFSKDMIQILDDICAATLLTQTAEQTLAGPELQLEFSSRLLVLSSDHRCPASSRNYSLFEQCLCLALMVFVKLALRPQTSGASYGPLLGSSYLAMRIQQFIEGLAAADMEEAGTGDRHAELLLWMATMGAWAGSQTPLAASERDEDQQEEQMLVLGTSLWRELVCELDINTLDDFRVYMLSFLWLDESCGPFAINLLESRSVIEIHES